MTNICEYGCDREAHHVLGRNKKHCCSSHISRCPAFAKARAAKRKEKNPGWVKDRKATSKKMSESLKGKKSWNKGETKHTNASIAAGAEKLKGTTKSAEHKKKISDTKKAAPLNDYQLLSKDHPKKASAIRKQVSKQKGQKRTGNYKSTGHPGKLNPMYGKVGELHPAYKHVSDEEALYRKTARNMTARTKKTLDLSSYNIGKAGVEGAYQVDHIVSVVYGYENNIPVELIASIENLQVIPWEENLSKKHHLTDDARKLLNEWGY